ncbi:MAG: glycosyltransferase [Candidatus Omnitrophica bacterium]|nr:glycosyltransferase [Candidatus Omnitrophota bacterium]
MRFLYDIFFLVFAVGYLPFFLAKGKHRGGFLERLGILPASVRRKAAGRETVWIHGVSVGEVTLAVRLGKELKAVFPGTPFIFTTTTPAGKQVAEKLKDPGDTVLYFPVDFRFCVRRFIRNVRPRLVMIVETEIWPNLIWELSNKAVPMVLVNGRISDKAFRRYRRFVFFLGPLLRRFSGIGAQDETMRARFVELGADPARVKVTGNLKGDWRPPDDKAPATADLKGLTKARGWFLCIAGSTHEGEEKILFELAGRLRKKRPNFRLLVAPRHLHRLSAIEAEAGKNGLVHKSLSDFLKNSANGRDADVILLDEMGLLGALYEAADLVFIGGSLVPVGGHNPVEPAYFGKPIVFGPFMDNFKEMAQAFKQAGAGVESSAENLESEIAFLMDHPEKRAALGENAKHWVSRQAGAIQKNIEVFLK